MVGVFFDVGDEPAEGLPVVVVFFAFDDNLDTE
jgi:hypothetical protein